LSRMAWTSLPAGTAVDPIEETDELLVAMSRHALTNHGAIEDIERGPVAVRRRATRCWVRL